MNRFVFRLATVAVAAGVMTLPGMAQTSDNGFITKAMESSYAEVRLGCLAQSKAQDPQVKDFATMMIDDHSQALQRLHSMNGAVADTTNTTTTPDVTNDRDSVTIDRNSVTNDRDSATTDRNSVTTDRNSVTTDRNMT